MYSFIHLSRLKKKNSFVGMEFRSRNVWRDAWVSYTCKIDVQHVRLRVVAQYKCYAYMNYFWCQNMVNSTYFVNAKKTDCMGSGDGIFL